MAKLTDRERRCILAKEFMIYDILKGFTVIDGYGYTSITNPRNVHDAIIIKCDGMSSCRAPNYNSPYHTLEEYTEIINANKIEKAQIILNDISFLNNTPSLKYLDIIPSYQASADFDFSPLYDLPNLVSLSCNNTYGNEMQYTGKIDCSKFDNLVDLGISVNKNLLNLDKIETLKSLHISEFKGKNSDLTDLTNSKELDTLRLIKCKNHSLNGIDFYDKLQCLYIEYNHSLKDISALKKVKKSLKALRVECCPKIQDFSVLEELENLEMLELIGNNAVDNFSFLKKMKRLSHFSFSMKVLDGDLSLCMDIPRVDVLRQYKHYNLHNNDLPKSKTFKMGLDGIDQWRRIW